MTACKVGGLLGSGTGAYERDFYTGHPGKKPSAGITSSSVNGKEKHKNQTNKIMDENQFPVTRDLIAVSAHVSTVRVILILCTSSAEDSPWKPVFFEVSLL